MTNCRGGLLLNADLYFSANSEIISRFPLFPSVIPVYYMPVPQPSESATTQGVSPSQEKLNPSSTQSAPQNPYSKYCISNNCK